MELFEHYVYPPRPEQKFAFKHLTMFETMNKFIAQPKMNGSCCVSICKEQDARFYNRHKETFATFKFPKQEILQHLTVDGVTIFCGEYLNKSQAAENDVDLNHSIVLFDIIQYNNEALIGKTVEERQMLLRSLFPTTEYSPWIDQISEKLFIVKNFEKDFEKVWKEITPIPLYEGLVLKNKTAKLRPGTTENNNTDWAIKCRKETKNYRH